MERGECRLPLCDQRTLEILCCGPAACNPEKRLAAQLLSSSTIDFRFASQRNKLEAQAACRNENATSGARWRGSGAICYEGFFGVVAGLVAGFGVAGFGATAPVLGFGDALAAAGVFGGAGTPEDTL